MKRVVGFLMCKIYGIEMGNNCYVGLSVKVIKMGGVKLGDSVIIRPGCRLFSQKRNGIKIKDCTEIGEYSTISAYNQIIIEEGVLTGPHVFISDHNHKYEDICLPVYQQGVAASSNSIVHIGSGSWLGTNSVVVGDVHIGKHCVIGANSVVTKDIPDYCVAAGIPAKIIKRYNFETNCWERV